MMLGDWGHPVASRYLSQQYVTAAMQAEAKESWEFSTYNSSGSRPKPSHGDTLDEIDGSESLSSAEDGLGINFPPVANLMQVLRAMELDMKRNHLPLHLQRWSMNRVEESCLQESQSAASSRTGCVYPL